MPYGQVNLRTHAATNGWEEPSTLSELGSEQLEMVLLSSLTGNATFGEKAENAIRFIRTVKPDQVQIVRMSASGNGVVDRCALHMHAVIFMLSEMDLHASVHHHDGLLQFCRYELPCATNCTCPRLPLS